MTDDELRALVRAALAQHADVDPVSTAPGLPPVARHHASHQLFALLPAGADAGGPCLIEPTVTCNHCGYCQSYGH